MELDNRYIGAHLCIKISTFAEEIVAKQGMDVQSKFAASQEACLPNAHSLIIYVLIHEPAIEIGLFLSWNLIRSDWWELRIMKSRAAMWYERATMWACVLQSSSSIILL